MIRDTRRGLALIALTLAFAAGAFLGSRLTGRGQPDAEIQAERDSATARKDAALAHVARLRADSAAKEALVQQAQTTEDSALGEANKKDRRIRELERLALRPVAPGSDIIIRDTVALARTCEERYQLRSGEALDLRASLAACNRGKLLERQRYGDAMRTVGRLTLDLMRSDQERVREVERSDRWRGQAERGPRLTVSFAGGAPIEDVRGVLVRADAELRVWSGWSAVVERDQPVIPDEGEARTLVLVRKRVVLLH